MQGQRSDRREMAVENEGNQMSEMFWKPREEEFQEGRSGITFKKHFLC